MPASTITKGIARRALVENTALDVTGSGGAALGAYNVSQYARLCGVVSIIGSGTIRYQMGVNSGNFLVTSSFIVSSGNSSFDVLQFGQHVNLSFSQLASQTSAKILILGDPSR